MRVTFGFAAAIVAMFFGGHVFAQEIGACLDKNGGLNKVTVGGMPSCTGSTTLISWNQTGPQGEPGTAGTQGLQGDAGSAGASAPIEVIKGPGGRGRYGQEVSAYAAGDCVAAFGAGARWATTNDLITLSWDPNASTDTGWVNWYPIQRDSAGKYTDRSGWYGPINLLVCGRVLTNKEIPWADLGGDTQGFCANSTSARPASCACTDQMSAICVAPKS